MPSTTLRFTPDQLLELQKEILAYARTGLEPGTMIHLAGSGGGGKTVGALGALIIHSRMRPGRNRYFLCGVSVKTADSNLFEIAEAWAAFLRLPFSRFDGGYKIGDARFFLFGASDITSRRRIQGGTFHGALLDEAVEYPSGQSFLDMARTRFRVERPLVFTTGNPAGPRHWYAKEILDKASETGDIVIEAAKRAIWGNFHLPAGFAESLEKSLPPYQRQRLLQGEWVVAEGLVYPYWVSHRCINNCVVTKGDCLVPRFPPPVVGVDYGHGTEGVTAAIATTAWRDRTSLRDTLTYITGDEYYHVGPLDPNLHADRMIAKWPKAHFVIDPAPPPLYQALLARAPGRVHKARKGEGSVLRGINHANALLQAGRILIAESHCPNLCDERASYVWSDTVAPITGADRPVKKNDHCMDAWRYGLEHLLEANEVRDLNDRIMDLSDTLVALAR